MENDDFDKGQNAGKLDYAKSLFGYANKEKSYKTKLAFSDAVIQNDVEEKAPVILDLLSPKPTDYRMYLKQVEDSEFKTYNDDDFKSR